LLRVIYTHRQQLSCRYKRRLKMIRVITLRSELGGICNKICECAEIDSNGQCDCFLNDKVVGAGHYELPSFCDVFSSSYISPLIYRLEDGPQKSLGLTFNDKNALCLVRDGKFLSALKRVEVEGLKYSTKIDGTRGLYLIAN